MATQKAGKAVDQLSKALIETIIARAEADGRAAVMPLKLASTLADYKETQAQERAKATEKGRPSAAPPTQQIDQNDPAAQLARSAGQPVGQGGGPQPRQGAQPGGGGGGGGQISMTPGPAPEGIPPGTKPPGFIDRMTGPGASMSARLGPFSLGFQNPGLDEITANQAQLQMWESKGLVKPGTAAANMEMVNKQYKGYGPVVGARAGALAAEGIKAEKVQTILSAVEMAKEWGAGLSQQGRSEMMRLAHLYLETQDRAVLDKVEETRANDPVTKVASRMLEMEVPQAEAALEASQANTQTIQNGLARYEENKRLNIDMVGDVPLPDHVANQYRKSLKEGRAHLFQSGAELTDGNISMTGKIIRQRADSGALIVTDMSGRAPITREEALKEATAAKGVFLNDILLPTGGTFGLGTDKSAVDVPRLSRMSSLARANDITLDHVGSIEILNEGIAAKVVADPEHATPAEQQAMFQKIDVIRDFVPRLLALNQYWNTDQLPQLFEVKPEFAEQVKGQPLIPSAYLANPYAKAVIEDLEQAGMGLVVDPAGGLVTVRYIGKDTNIATGQTYHGPMNQQLNDNILEAVDQLNAWVALDSQNPGSVGTEFHGVLGPNTSLTPQEAFAAGAAAKAAIAAPKKVEPAPARRGLSGPGVKPKPARQPRTGASGVAGGAAR